MSMTIHDFLIMVENNLRHDFSDQVEIKFKEDNNGNYFHFKMDDYNICLPAREFYSDYIMDGNDFNEYLAQSVAKRIENTVAKIYIKRLFKENGY